MSSLFSAFMTVFTLHIFGLFIFLLFYVPIFIYDSTEAVHRVKSNDLLLCCCSKTLPSTMKRVFFVLSASDPVRVSRQVVGAESRLMVALCHRSSWRTSLWIRRMTATPERPSCVTPRRPRTTRTGLPRHTKCKTQNDPAAHLRLSHAPSLVSGFALISRL